MCSQLVFPTPSPAQVVMRTGVLGPPWASCRPWRPCVPKLALAIGYFMNTLGTHLGNTGCSQGVFSACALAPVKPWRPCPPTGLGGPVFPRCVLCLCVGPVLGLLQSLEGLCSQGVFSACVLGASWASCRPWRPCVPKVCSQLVCWACFGLLQALAALCSQGVFSACALLCSQGVF